MDRRSFLRSWLAGAVVAVAQRIMPSALESIEVSRNRARNLILLPSGERTRRPGFQFVGTPPQGFEGAPTTYYVVDEIKTITASELVEIVVP